MRVRDVINGSLDMLVDAGLLPPYPPKVRADLSLAHQGSPYTPEMLRTIALNDRSHPFYKNATALRRAAGFVQGFKVGAAHRTPRPYPLPRCFGPLGAMSLADGHNQIEEAFKSIGFKVLSHNSANNSGTFELSEQTTVEKLPHFYGSWLYDQYKRDPWRENLDLRLIIDIKLALSSSGGARPERFADIDLSAPAIAVLQALYERLRGSFPLGPSPAARLIADIARGWP